MDLYIWLGIIVLAVIVEFSTSEMISIWFAGGGLVSTILAGFGVSWYIQLPVFIVISFVGMLVFRKYVMTKLNKNVEKTNADSVIGKDFALLTPIKFNSTGTIKVNDVIWNVITANPNEEVKEGTIVTVKEIKGNKYIVEVKL